MPAIGFDTVRPGYQRAFLDQITAETTKSKTTNKAPLSQT